PPARTSHPPPSPPRRSSDLRSWALGLRERHPPRLRLHEPDPPPGRSEPGEAVEDLRLEGGGRDQQVVHRVVAERLRRNDRQVGQDRKSTRLNSSHVKISYAV